MDKVGLPGRRVAPANPSDDAAPPRRAELEQRWLDLTRKTLPALASARGWPVSADHCFQRVLLDHATGGVWYDAIAGRPAYRHATDVQLIAALMLGDEVVAGTADLAELDRRSKAWRAVRRAR